MQIAGDDIEAIAKIFSVHPCFFPAQLRRLLGRDPGPAQRADRVGDCPALEEGDPYSWFAGLRAAPHRALDAIAGAVNPRARCHPVENPKDARLAWDVVIDPAAAPQESLPSSSWPGLSKAQLSGSSSGAGCGLGGCDELPRLSDPRDRSCTACYAARPPRSPTHYSGWTTKKISYAESVPRERVGGGAGELGGRAPAIRSRSCSGAGRIRSMRRSAASRSRDLIPVNVDYRGAWLRANARGRRRARARGRAELCRAWPARAGYRFEHAIVVAARVAAALPWPTTSAAGIARAPGKVPAPSDPGTGPGDIACVLWTSGPRGLEGRDAEPQRVDPRGALGAQNSGIRDGDVALRLPADVQLAAWVAHVSAPSSRRAVSPRCQSSGCRSEFGFRGVNVVAVLQHPEHLDSGHNPASSAFDGETLS